MTVDPATLPRNATTELGSQLSWFQKWAGVDPGTGDWIDLETEFASRDIEDMIARDGRAAAVAKVITLPLRAAALAIKPGKGDTGQAERVNAALERMSTPLPLIVGQGAQSLIYRATFMEKIFDVSRGQVDYEAIAWRPPETCLLRRDKGTGRLVGFQQRVIDQPAPVQIPIEKAVVFLHGADVNPVRGVSEMQVSYRCYQDKQKLRALWMIMLERAAAPWVVVEVNSGEENSTAQTLSKLRAGGVAALSNLKGSPTVLNVQGNAAELFEKAVHFLDAEMAGSVLASFLGLGDAASMGRGSYALSKDQTDFFTSSEDAAAREIASTIREQVVTPLVRFNDGPDATVPNVQLGPISGATTEQAVSMLQALASAPSGEILPREFVDELTVMVATKFDMDVDKIVAAVKKTADAAATSPASAPSAPLHAVATVGAEAARRAAPVQAAAAGL